jgi:methyltransferase
LLGVFILLQGMRIWVLVTLGRRWTTRIIVLPGAPLVTNGPFRFIRHPNYCVVVGEIAVLPLVFGLTWIAAIWSILNAAMLWVRIRSEAGALYDIECENQPSAKGS